MKKLFRAALRANLYSMVIATKIGVLLLWGFLQPDAPDYFGRYALCLGLTSTFFIFAGMRGRIYVFGGIDSFNDFAALTRIIALFGIIALAVVVLLYTNHSLRNLLLLVAAAKFIEMFLDTNTSYIQKTLGRDQAFTLLNQHSLLLICGFSIGLISGGLEGAILCEIAVLALTILRQSIVLRSRPEPETIAEYGAKAVLFKGGELTLAATLNSAMVTGFLYWGSGAMPEIELLIIAKVLALQAFCARLITGNNIFFLQEMTDGRQSIVRIARQITMAGFGALTLMAAIYATLPQMVGEAGALYGFGIAFTLINVANIAIRQQLLLGGVIRPVTVFHTAELAFLMALFYVSSPTAIVAFGIFSILRLLRTLYFTHLLAQQPTA